MARDWRFMAGQGLLALSFVAILGAGSAYAVRALALEALVVILVVGAACMVAGLVTLRRYLAGP